MRLPFFIAVILVSVAAARAAEPLQCPARIDIAEGKLAKPLPGWTVFTADSPHVLSNVSIYEGRPEEHADLEPDQAGKNVVVWKLLPQEMGYWLGCHYSGTTVSIARQIPKEVRSCTVEHDPAVHVDGYASIKRITCR